MSGKYKMCRQCEINPVYEFTNKRKLCKNCFLRYFQKKLFYTIRKFKLIKPGEIIAYENKKDFRGIVLENALKTFSEKLMIKLVKSSGKKSNKKATSGKCFMLSSQTRKKAVSSTIDLESDKIIHTLINGKVSELKEVAPIEKIKNQTIIKPLYLFLDKEVLLYAEIRKLKFKKIKEKQDNITKFIDHLEEKHPEVKRAVVNSYLELYS